MDGSARYPSYVSFDDMIDVDRLKLLDAYVRTRIEQRLAAAEDRRFYTGPFVLEDSAPRLPGSRMIYLAQSTRPDSYYDLDRTEFWRPTPEVDEFAELMDFIRTLPFAATGRMLIIYDPDGHAVTAHRDHDDIDACHEFLWFRTNLDKPFYMLDPGSGERRYVSSHSAWFDTVNQFHGADATGRLSFSIRVDGVFDEALRARIPYPSANRASAPSVWAAT